MITIPCTWFTRRDRPKGERRELDLVALVSKPIVTADKMAMPLFSPARFHHDYRKAANVAFTYALGFDLDVGNATPDVIEHAFAGMRAVYYSSSSHTDAAPRGRAIVLLARGVGPKTYRGAWRIVRGHAERRGLPIASEACDPSRAWFVPGHKPGAPYYCGSLEGEPIDVDRIAAAVAAEEEARALRQRVAQARSTYSSRSIEGALTDAWNYIATAGEGERNNRLNRAAYRLAGMKIAKSTIEKVLTDAARVAGLPETEAAKTIASGIRAGGGL